MIAKQHSYEPKTPHEVPATMQFEDDHEKDRMFVHVRRVNETYLFHDSKAVQNNQFQLSPGSVKLVLWIFDDGASSQIPVNIDIKSGEHYQLHMEHGRVWINDKAGVVISEIKYEIKTRWTMPVRVRK